MEVPAQIDRHGRDTRILGPSRVGTFTDNGKHLVALRAGVTENPVRLTQSVKATLTHVSCGGAAAYVWPGGGITVMVDVMDMPTDSFGYVPTPALVAPIEFTLRREDYGTLGGHMEHIRPVADVMTPEIRRVAPTASQPDPNDRENYGWRKTRE